MERGRVLFVGTVVKLIDRSGIREPQLAHIAISGADFLYDEIRIPNFCNWNEGENIHVTIRTSAA